MSVQALLDATDNNTANVSISYSEAVVQAYSHQLQLEWLHRQGQFMIQPSLSVDVRTWFNEDLESMANIVPGVVAIVMAVIGAFLTSLTIAREWERGTMEQLISTPVRGPELVLGKLLPYFCIGMLDVVIAVIMGEFLFHVPLRGSVVLLFAVAAVFLVGALFLGLLISILAKTQTLASELAMLATLLPAFLLSGFAFAIRNMPPFVQAITYLIPARYLVTMLKGIYLKGVGLEVFATDAALLALFSAGMVALAIGLFRKRLG